MAGYDEAHTRAAFYRVPAPGYLRIGGADQRDFIQRQTTNDVRLLTPERALLTALTSGTARILDVWRLVMDADAIGVITLPGRGAATEQYLRTRIFFMDKVTVASEEIAQIEVVGPAAGDALQAVGLPALPEPDQVVTIQANGGSLRGIGLIGRGWLLLTPAGSVEALIERLAPRAAALDSATYETLRVEGGLPGPARELTQDYTPLEATLDGAISGDKGCYSGQEVIARQITYDKIARRMAGLRLDAPVTVGAAVQAGGRSAGEITSAVESPRFGAIALAVLRRPHFEPGTAITVTGADGGLIAGETVALPFESS